MHKRNSIIVWFLVKIASLNKAIKVMKPLATLFIIDQSFKWFTCYYYSTDVSGIYFPKKQRWY